jgi:hypothetical protein
VSKVSEKCIEKIGASPLSRVHARSIDRVGKIAPRCGAYKGTRQQLDMLVTADPKRVTCALCARSLS